MSSRTSTSPRPWLLAGGLCGLLAVALGAFGAHGLRHLIAPERLVAWGTATDYLALHGVVILICGVLLSIRTQARLVEWAARAFLLGTLLFSGSLFALVLTDLGALGAITPFGGLLLIGGWALLTLAGWRWHTAAPEQHS